MTDLSDTARGDVLLRCEIMITRTPSRRLMVSWALNEAPGAHHHDTREQAFGAVARTLYEWADMLAPYAVEEPNTEERKPK